MTPLPPQRPRDRCEGTETLQRSLWGWASPQGARKDPVTLQGPQWHPVNPPRPTQGGGGRARPKMAAGQPSGVPAWGGGRALTPSRAPAAPPSPLRLPALPPRSVHPSAGGQSAPAPTRFKSSWLIAAHLRCRQPITT